jgi:hypothetical protein
MFLIRTNSGLIGTTKLYGFIREKRDKAAVANSGMGDVKRASIADQRKTVLG